ncbi:MAG: membrane dipeptidase [Chitinophagaceae bacterium]|nr:membrane dipeptidase [Anaerolineae bacterium]
MIIVDAHQDIAYNAVCFGRDYLQSALRKRQLETSTDIPAQAGIATLGLPEAIAGRVAVVFATLFVAPRSPRPAPWKNVMYDDISGAYRLALQQMDTYQRLADDSGQIRLIRSHVDLDAVLATWGEDKTVKDRQQGLVILMENADPIIEPRQFEEWYERGVRIVGPAWQASRYSAGTGAPGPLTPLGRELLEVMANFNAILDLSHMAEIAFLEALDRYTGTVIASHSNPRHFCDTDRHLTDAMIRRLAERNGVMGVVMLNSFLDGKWSKTDTKKAVTFSTVVDIIDYVCQLTGSAAYVGLGSDFDGGFGAESIPAEIDTTADLWYLRKALVQRGYNEDDITAILGGNMLRKLREALPAR